MNESSTKIKKKKSDNNLEVQLAQKNAELKIISSVGEAMSNQLDINTVTKIVGDKIRDIFEAEVTEILLLNYLKYWLMRKKSI